MTAPLRTSLCAAFALIAFAANSVLCRTALGNEAVDAASFTTLRVASGAVTLLLLTAASRGGRITPLRGSWASAAMLFGYMVAFSFAYLSLATGTGALILFGAVQATMLLWALRSGERPHALVWVGLVLALGGLVYLVFPGVTAPSPTGALLMAVAGISWGVYSLHGRGSRSPLADTTGNFVRTLPLVAVVSLIALSEAELSTRGVLLAVASGALASGIGYAVWYAALPGLTATRAAMLQLSVPVIAALGGVAFLGESPSSRLMVASIAILGGVALATLGRGRTVRRD